MDSNLPPEINPPSASPIAPPPFTRPPIIPPALPSRSPSRNTGWKIFAVVLVLMLVMSLILNFQQAVNKVFGGKIKRSYSNVAYGPRLEEVVVRADDSPNKIVVVPIEGIITGQAIQSSDFSLVSLVKAELKRAREDKEVRAVVLKVNSPGGEVLASDEIAKAIAEFEDKSSKPVIVSMGSLAASGGYYVSAPCTWIVANELTITGSIGVIMHELNYRGLLDKIGVKPEVFKSGKYKDMLSGTKSPEETSPEERQMVQALIDETFAKFKNVVADGRQAAYENNKHEGKPLDTDWESLADGRILSGKDAFKHGFVDELGDFDVAVNRAKRLAHIQNANLVEYQQMFDIGNIFRMLGESNTKSVKLELGVDMPKLQAGYLYFLSPTYLQ